MTFMKKSPLILAVLITAAVPLKLTAGLAYWDGNDSTPGAGDTPNGIWVGSPFWSVDPAGGLLAGVWTPGDTAVFSAGTDALNPFTVTGSGTSGAPGVIAAGIVVEEGFVTLSGGTVGLGAGPVTIKAGASLSTDNSQRISTTAGSVWTLDGGTARSTNPATAGSFIDLDSTITLGPAGGTISYTTANLLNIVQPTTIISGPGSLTKTGAGVLAIASPCTYLGPTTISDGELRIRTTPNRLPVTTAVTVNDPGILNLNSVSQQIGSLTGNGLVGLGNATLTVGDATSTIYGGSIRDTANAGASGTTSVGGKVTKVGVGGLTLTGVNTYTGAFTLTDGIVTVDPAAQLSSATSNLIVNGGVLNLNNAAHTAQNLSGTGGTINLATGHTLTIGPIASSTYAGTIAGAGALIKNSSSTEILSGPNSYDGTTTVNLGRLQVGSATALGSAVGNTQVASGAELLFDGATTTFTVAEPLQIAGPGLDGGAITIQNSSTPTISGPVTLTGDATVTVSSTATGTFSNANAFTSQANQNLTLQGGSGAGGGGTISGAITLGTGGLTKLQGGKWTLTGVNTYSGTTTISAGTLQLGNGLAGGDGTISNSPSVVNNAALVFNRFGSDSYSGAISGTGTVTKTGAGTQTLSGANSYTGATTVSGGTLKVGNASALGFGGVQTIATAATTVGAGFTLDLNGTSSVNEPIVLNGAGVGANGALINSAGTTATIGNGIAGAQVPAITGTGSSYSAAPTVIIAGTGSGATATATLGVTAASFTLDFGDKTYTTAPTVTIGGGSGSGATAAAVLSGGTTGTLTGITITNAGTGYTTAPTIAFGAGAFSAGTISGSGTGNATEFTVSGIAVTAAGTGYTGIPTYTFGTGNATPGTVTLSSVVLAANSSIGGTGDITVNSAISESGGAKTLTKTGNGTLVINGPQSYSSLAASGGRTTLNSSLANATITDAAGAILNLNADATNSNVTVDGNTAITVSQTLASLTIHAGGVVRLGGPAFSEPPAPELAGAVNPVPEPASAGLLILGALGLLARRRR